MTLIHLLFISVFLAFIFFFLILVDGCQVYERVWIQFAHVLFFQKRKSVNCALFSIDSFSAGSATCDDALVALQFVKWSS